MRIKTVYRFCGCIIETDEYLQAEPYHTYIKKAGEIVGITYATNITAQEERDNLVKAIKYNLINRKEYPFEFLLRKYKLPLSHTTFDKEKRLYSLYLFDLIYSNTSVRK